MIRASSLDVIISHGTIVHSALGNRRIGCTTLKKLHHYVIQMLLLLGVSKYTRDILLKTMHEPTLIINIFLSNEYISAAPCIQEIILVYQMS